MSFYDEAFQIIESHNKFNIKIYHRIQANGTLISKKWISFFKKWSVNIGISVDPPGFIHDKYRMDRSVNGTFNLVLMGINLINSENYPFHVITTLTPEALNYPDTIWKLNGIKNVSLNPVSIDWSNRVINLNSGISYEKFKNFIYKILTLRENSGVDIFLRWEDTERAVIENGIETERDAGKPLQIITIDAAGNLSAFTSVLATVTHANYGSLYLQI